MKIYIKGTYTPFGDVQINVYDQQRESIEFKENIIELTTGGKEIIATKTFEASQQDIDYFMDKQKLISREERLEKYMTDQQKDVKLILQYIQAFNSIFNLHTELAMKSSYEWSKDKINWEPVPDKRITTWKGAGLQVKLPDNLMGNIARMATTNIPVFQAFTHLYKAYSDTNPRFKWINGTIAAEHAFKEFLSLKDPRAESLMLHVPSPPLERLYKTVLHAYTGKESSMYKELQKGATKRNDLIHKPASPSPGLMETNIYLHQVEVAIFELYSLLYPLDPFFDYLLKGAKDRLKHVEQGGNYYQ